MLVGAVARANRGNGIKAGMRGVQVAQQQALQCDRVDRAQSLEHIQHFIGCVPDRRGMIIAYMGFDMLNGRHTVGQAPPMDDDAAAPSSLAPLIMFAATRWAGRSISAIAKASNTPISCWKPPRVVSASASHPMRWWRTIFCRADWSRRQDLRRAAAPIASCMPGKQSTMPRLRRFDRGSSVQLVDCHDDGEDHYRVTQTVVDGSAMSAEGCPLLALNGGVPPLAPAFARSALPRERVRSLTRSGHHCIAASSLYAHYLLGEKLAA